jgi:hypothetical protein
MTCSICAASPYPSSISMVLEILKRSNLRSPTARDTAPSLRIVFRHPTEHSHVAAAASWRTSTSITHILIVDIYLDSIAGVNRIILGLTTTSYIALFTIHAHFPNRKHTNNHRFQSTAARSRPVVPTTSLALNEQGHRPSNGQNVPQEEGQHANHRWQQIALSEKIHEPYSAPLTIGWVPQPKSGTGAVETW